MSLPTPPSFPPEARGLARRYAGLEAGLRRAIDRVAAAACPACPSPCCRVHYCRETARNPWYRFVHEAAGGAPPPPDWETRRDAFGLGPRGCEIRAGRYAFCYSYNCPRLLGTLPDSRRGAFQELSDLLLAVNRLPGGRLLHELADSHPLRPGDLEALDRSVAAAAQRLQDLLSRFPADPTPASATGQAHQKGNP